MATLALLEFRDPHTHGLVTFAAEDVRKEVVYRLTAIDGEGYTLAKEVTKQEYDSIQPSA